MIDELTLCVGGQFSASEVCKKDFELAFLCIDRMFGIEFERVVNAKGFPVKRTTQSWAAMLRRETWEILGGLSGNERLDEYARWNIALYVSFLRKRSFFLGVDPFKFDFDPKSKLEMFLEDKLISFGKIRYAYLFEQKRSSCPQCFVYGGSVMTTWQQMMRDKAQDWHKLHRWWHARIFAGQEKSVVRDVFESNYFLDANENEFLDGLMQIAGCFGSVDKMGDYFIWRVARNDIHIARAELIARGLIGPPL